MDHSVEKTVRAHLASMADANYRAFQARLMPNVAAERVMGVRTPQLRAFACELGKTPDAQCFMACLPHAYYEEDNLHGFLIEQIRDFDACVAALNDFLPYVDNWATCDMMNPKALGKDLPKLRAQVEVWLKSEHEYTARFAIGLLMRYFLDEAFEEEYLELVAGVSREEYYIRMMVAWYFATALAKQWEAAFPYIEGRRLGKWVHNKTIQKAIESRRISPERKRELKEFRL